MKKHRFSIAIGVATLTAVILALPRTPVAAPPTGRKAGNGVTGPWEKTAGPPGIRTDVIFKANNIVYAGTETQGVYKSTDNGSNWVAANTGIERASINVEDNFVVGASAGIFGVFAALATIEPYAEMRLFFLIPVRLRYLLIAAIVGSLFYILLPKHGTMAHAAHLGGILFGMGYIHWGMNSTPAWDEWNPLRRKLRREKMIRAANVKPALLRRRPKTDEPTDLPSEEFISKQVDPILDKISAHGIQSLTERERQILQAARARMSKR